MCRLHILAFMDRLWTPWRYNYITGATEDKRKGVPAELAGWPGEDQGCVFCNLIRSVRWGMEGRIPDAERAGLVVAQGENCFICLNRFPYSSGHILIVPYRHTDQLAKLNPEEATEAIQTAQRMERVLRDVYQPDGVNLGLNLGEAAGAGVAQHMHVHMLPRWFGDTSFMTVTAETRMLPETLDVTWERLRSRFRTVFPEEESTKL